MATGDSEPAIGLVPVAVIWCRQVDNEAESPGYTTIPEEFPGRRETLESVRLIGNLTINIADTHDYWDPDPAQPLSFYPNLFLYPAGNGRYTCIGRMFLSTEDRPRLGMKTLVFATSDLLATGEFGAAVVRAHASMGGPSTPPRPEADPDPSVYQAVGEGFLFHRGSTEPVVLVAAEPWDAVARVVLDLVALLPGSLVALGAFLVFPYFLPEAKVNIHEFTEQLPLALAVMRVPRTESQGERHAKRIQSWEDAPVALRDLTHPPSPRDRSNVPLVLQYARDHAEEKLAEIGRRVDQVESGRNPSPLHDAERQGGRDRRKEMWRIGTAMETAAMLLSRPKGRSIPMSGETARRASEYVQAQPAVPILHRVDASPPAPGPAPGPTSPQLPPWLKAPTDVRVPTPDPRSVPVSVHDDPSTLPRAPATPAAWPSVPATPGPAPVDETHLEHLIDRKVGELAKGLPPPPDVAQVEARLLTTLDARFREGSDQSAQSVQRLETALGDRFTTLDTRLRESSDQSAQTVQRLESALGERLTAFDVRLRESSDQSAQTVQRLEAALGARLTTLETRPEPDPAALFEQLDQQTQSKLDHTLALLDEKLRQVVQASGERWAERFREELRHEVEELKARSLRGEEELRAALAAQLDLELAETKEQGTALREEVEGRVRQLFQDRTAELDQRRAKEVRDLESRLAILIDGRSKDLETRMLAVVQGERDKLLGLTDERILQAEQRLDNEREARVAEVGEAGTAAVAALQVRMQAFVEQKLRENQDREREKYVELLARLKNDVDQSLARSMESNRFDVAVRDRVTRLLEGTRAEQEKSVAQALLAAEGRLKSAQSESILRLERLETKLQQREVDLGRVERNLRQEADDLDRRILVLSDRVLPLTRKTWAKVAELEKRAPGSEETESRVNELRRELVRELRRVEGELLEQTSDLRDRLEGTIAHQGRIWLNLLRQLSAETEESLKRGPHSARRPARSGGGISEEELLAAALRATPEYPSFAGDPPNPIDPSPVLEPGAGDQELRRRTRRA